ncbi:MAG TPA: hypothetical protein VM533_13325 [Fimbriiglobus sp.]|nr:hypothetical protein [Fimbriiglobus sp.]
MAFNPFNVFRRNQKVLFALLTILVMFMFVLSSGLGGGGDFFDWLPRLIGSNARSGDVLATIDGSKVYESDLQRIQTKRTLANQYMSAAAAQARENLHSYVTGEVSRVSAENRQVIQYALSVGPMYLSPQTAQLLNNPQLFNQFMAMGMISPQAIQQEQQQTIAGLQARLGEIAEKAPQEEDKEVARTMQSLIDLDVRLQSAGRQGQYFTNLPNVGGNKDLMEFKLWLTKAEDLGVSFTAADIADLVHSEFYRKINDEDLKAVEASLKNKVGYNAELLKDALGDEFKVRIAQSAVLGRAALRPMGQSYDAPYDYYRYYRDQTSTARFGMLTVPVENYVSRVQGTPTETELRDIFNKHKNDVPNPTLARPGLKEPRKLKLEWLEAAGNEPYYKQAAAEGVKLAGAMTRANGFLALASSLGGVTTAAVLAAPAPLAMQDPVLDTKYAEYKAAQRNIARDHWYSSSPFADRPQVLDRGFLRPENAGAVSGAVGPAGQSFEGDRIAKFGTIPPALIAPVAPGFGVPTVLIATAAAQAKATEPLPLDAVRGRLVERAAEDMARTIAEGDLQKFQEEMTKFNVAKAGTDAASQAQAYLEKFVKERGLKTGKSEEFRDQFHIGTDPGLQVIRQRIESQRPGTYVDPAMIGAFFFADVDPRSGRPAPGAGLYRPQVTPPGGPLQPSPYESVLMVWRTAEQPAEAPRNFDEARPKAEAAWKELKARELAKKDAEELAEKARNLGTSFFEIEQKLKDLQAQFAGKFDTPEAKARIKYFEVDDVAPMVVTSLPSGAGPRYQASPFNMTSTVNIPYPSEAMARALIESKDKPLSSSLVVSDQPEDQHYVAVVLDHKARGADRFKDEVYDPRASFDVAAAISGRHQEELRKQARDRALAMLKAEFKYEEKSDKANQTSETSDE